MYRILTIIAVALLFMSPAFAAVPSYKLLKEKSSLKFYAINNNAPVEGEFKDFSTEIEFSPEKLEESKIKVEVTTASVFASYDEVVKNLISADWLAAEKFPKAVFVSKAMSRMPNSDNYYADGTLQLRDKTLPVMLNFQLKPVDDKTMLATGYVTLRRTDFGVGQGQWAKDDVVKNEVRVEFRVVAQQQ